MASTLTIRATPNSKTHSTQRTPTPPYLPPVHHECASVSLTAFFSAFASYRRLCRFQQSDLGVLIWLLAHLSSRDRPRFLDSSATYFLWPFFFDTFAATLWCSQSLSNSSVLLTTFSRCFKGSLRIFHGAETSHLIRYSSAPFLVRFSSALPASQFTPPSIRIGSGFGSLPPSEPREHRASSSEIVDSEKNRHCCGSIFHQRSSVFLWL